MATEVSREVKARPEGFWNDTGVNVKKGDRVTISYSSGQWRTNPHWGPVGAEGSSTYIAGGTYIVPGAPEGSLVGKVGGNNSGGGSVPFAVGRLATVPNDLEGLLWLTANDEIGGQHGSGFGDNHGSITVRIKIE